MFNRDKKKTCNSHAKLRLEKLEARENPAAWMAIGAGEGGGPHVIIRADLDGDGKFESTTASFFAFDGRFRGGVRIAVGDLNGDGNMDLITAAGAGGGSHVKIWGVDGNGRITGLREEFFAFQSDFRGGSWVAAGSLFGIGNIGGTYKADLVIGAGEGGGPHVKIFRDTDGDGFVSDNLVDEFYAYDAGFRGGVRELALGRFSEPLGQFAVHPAPFLPTYLTFVITAAGPGGTPHVRVWDYGENNTDLRVSNNRVVADFLAFDESYHGGVFVTAAGLTRDNYYMPEDLVVSAGSQVKVFAMPQHFYAENGIARATLRPQLLESFNAEPGHAGNVHVSSANKNTPSVNTDVGDLIVSGSKVSIWSGDGHDGLVSHRPKEDEFYPFGFGIGSFTAFWTPPVIDVIPPLRFLDVIPGPVTPVASPPT